MKKLTAIAGLVLLSFIAVVPTGCKSKLDPAGSYQSDKTLYTADKTITEAYDLLHTFVSFEFKNREALRATPEVKAAADEIRVNAEKWIHTAISLRDAYAAVPNAENQRVLNQALGVLNAALAEASKYMQAGLAKTKTK